MRNAAYEHAYNEARNILHRRGKRVGGPRQGFDGVRRCGVDGVALTDRELLLEAWGESLADEIIAVQPGAESSPCVCLDCEQLWIEYTASVQHYLKIFTARDRAASRRDWDAVDRLVPMLRQAGESRRLLRRAFVATWSHPQDPRTGDDSFTSRANPGPALLTFVPDSPYLTNLTDSGRHRGYRSSGELDLSR